MLTTIFTTVLTLSIMSIVVVAFIVLAKLLLRERLSPRWGYLLWMLLLVRLLIPWSPESEWSVFNLIPPQETALSAATDGIGAAPDFAAGWHWQEDANTEAIARSSASGASDASDASDASATAAASNAPASTHPYRSAGEGDFAFSWWNGLALLWMAGFLAAVAYRLLIQRKFTLLLKKEATLCRDESRMQLLQHCRVKLGIDHDVHMLETDLVASPSLYGLRKQTLLLPRALNNGLDPVDWKYIFLHELSHIKRKDLAVNRVLDFLLLLHWFNPVLWFAERSIREDQELACDSLALTRIAPEEKRAYATTLIKMLQFWRGHSSTLSPGNMIGMFGNKHYKGYLRRRISMITLRKNPYQWSVVGVLTVVLVAFLALTGAKAAAPLTTDEQAVMDTLHTYYNATVNYADYEAALAVSKDLRYNREDQERITKALFTSPNLTRSSDTLTGYTIKRIEKVNDTNYNAYVAVELLHLGHVPAYERPVIKEDGKWIIVLEDITYITEEHLKDYYNNVMSPEHELLAANNEVSVYRNNTPNSISADEILK
ncbi:M56 family metallopeptidase [Paenibacillus plantiphilus]|uniref:M56 family metallopeptidase n=1 Tax=Paenibacillus plantiphilus TaxID=2905650 RepID=UPI001F22C841|nr:M56 family metallopeptidase [Paenibacillus plantiphilus]